MLKYKLCILFLFMLALLLVNYSYAQNSSLSLLGHVIYIDPGHGGKDSGATYKDVYESNINLSISLKLREILEKKGAIVLLTREGNYDLSISNASNRKRSDLSRRANLINNSKADIYLSIHLNSVSSSTWYGAQIFYDNINKKNIEIAKLFQNEFQNKLNTTRKCKKLEDGYMYKRINVPGVLIEVGFMSNSNERFLLQKDDYQYKISNIISNTLEKYFNN